VLFRSLTSTRFSNVITHEYPEALVIPQGSTATETSLPVSDIDLIIFNLPPDARPIAILSRLVKIFARSNMTSRGVVLMNAAVPIAKLMERAYGFNIDICIANINGALNVPRVQRVIQLLPFFKPLLMFLKLFTFALGIDDPPKGGIGSNQLVNFVLFALQTYRADGTLAGALLHLLDIFGRRLNYFLAGISTVDGGRLFSKQSLKLLTAECPQALVCEDPQFHGSFIGRRTAMSVDFRESCEHAREVLLDYDYTRGTGITAFMPNIDPIIARRGDLAKWHKLLFKSPEALAVEADKVPSYISAHESIAKGQREGPRRPQEKDYALMTKMEAKRQTKTIKRGVKKKKDRKKKAENQNLFGLWKQLQEEVRKNRHDIYTRLRNDAKAREKTPPKYRR
jgi:hypothetical protein